MRGFVGPGLVEDKIAKGVKNWFILINFRLLPNVGVVAMNDVSTSIDHLVGKVETPFFGLGKVFITPMDRDNKVINLGIKRLDGFENFLFIQLGVGNKIVTEETKGNPVGGFGVKIVVKATRNRLASLSKTTLAIIEDMV